MNNILLILLLLLLLLLLSSVTYSVSYKIIEGLFVLQVEGIKKLLVIIVMYWISFSPMIMPQKYLKSIKKHASLLFYKEIVAQWDSNVLFISRLSQKGTNGKLY